MWLYVQGSPSDVRQRESVRHALRVSERTAMLAKRVVVFGAGVAGLSVARRLSELGLEVFVYEKDRIIGGLARTFRNGDYLYDLGPHYFHRDLAEDVGIEEECKEHAITEIYVYEKRQREALRNLDLSSDPMVR